MQPAEPLLLSVYFYFCSSHWGQRGAKEDSWDLGQGGKHRSWKDLGEIVQLQGKEIHDYMALDMEKGV